MRSLVKLSTDLRDLSQMMLSIADEIDSIAALFSGGEVAAKRPFVPNASQTQPIQPKGKGNRKSPPFKGQKSNESQRLLVRQLWFTLQPSQQTLEAKREIGEKVGLHPSVVALIIRRTRQEDLSSFLKSQVPSS